jgi:hypothetical protein
MSLISSPGIKPGKTPDVSLLLPLKKRQIIITAGGEQLVQDTKLKQGFENGLNIVYAQKSLRCPCPTDGPNPPVYGDLAILSFTYSSVLRIGNSQTQDCNGNIITQMILTWTFNQPIQSASFNSCFADPILLVVNGDKAIYTTESYRPAMTTESEPIYYELTVNNSTVFTGYFTIPSCS